MKKELKIFLLALLIMSILAGLFSCTKASAGEIQPPGKQVWLISYKYTIDTVLLRVDTLWYDFNLPEKELLKIRAEKQTTWITFCDPPNSNLPLFLLEKRAYIIK